MESKGEQPADSETAKDGETAKDALFSGLLHRVNAAGPFQLRFNLLFNLLFTAVISMPYINIVLAMTVPDHWCHVPGREHRNYTVDQWKENTIPRDAAEESGFSKCLMNNASVFDTGAVAVNDSGDGGATIAVAGCQFGWEYDRTWYTSTAASQEDWVCERAIYTSNVFAATRAGEFVGAFIFGQLGDSFGRRPIYLSNLLLLLLGRSLSVITARSYPLFLLMAFLGSLPSTVVFQASYAIAIEISAEKHHTRIAMMQSVGYVLGLSTASMLAWAFSNWTTMMLVTTLPCTIFIAVHRYFLESPRWLASRGETGRCREVLERIARVNGTQLPPETDATLQQLAGQRERVFGVASLFSSRRLAVLTVLLSYSCMMYWSMTSIPILVFAHFPRILELMLGWITRLLLGVQFCNLVSYYYMTLRVGTLSGNPFLNFLWQSLAELPGYACALWSSDRCGRRWTQAGAFALLAATQLALVALGSDSRYPALQTTLVMLAKFFVTMSFYVIYLQSVEIFPTCVRQTGTSFTTLVGSGLAVLGPYILFLSEYDARFPPLVLGLLAASATVACSFLPETLHQRLPETLADARRSGSSQPYWQFRYGPKTQTKASAEERPLADEGESV